MSTLDGTNPKGGITQKEAVDWTGTWQSTYPNLSKAFLIPNADVLSLLEELSVLVPNGTGGYTVNSNPPTYGIRAYMAIGPDPVTKKDEEKLVMVGTVDVKGEYQDQVAGTPNPLHVTLKGSGAFDFTRPCPYNCDKNSPLNH